MPSQGSRPRSEGESEAGSINVERTDMGPGPSAEEVCFYLILFSNLIQHLFLLTARSHWSLWYLHVHTGDQRFR